MSPAASSRQPLRVAVIGTGLGSAPHFQSLQDIANEVEVAWVYGRKADECVAQYQLAGAQKAPDVRTICSDASVAAALVLTPPNTHLEVVQQLAMAGKHVLVEKPLEVSLQKAMQLVEACESHAVLLAVMLQHRLRPAALELSRLVKSGVLGELISAAASVRWWRPQSYYDEPGRGTLQRDGGGVLMTQAIHTLDLLLSLTGLPQSVVALARTSPLHQMECEDMACALLRFDSGAVAVVQASTAAYPGYPERIELNFTRGSATLEGGRLQLHRMGGESVSIGDPVGTSGSGGGADPMAFDHAPHRAVLQDFAAAVRQAGTPLVTGRSALAVQRVIEAMMASSRTGAAAVI